MANDPAAISPSGSSTDLLSVSRERQGAGVVVRFVGEIDLTSVGSVRTALTAASTDATAPHPIVLDLTGVGFLASAGLAELQTAHERAADQHTPLRIVATGRPVLRPWKSPAWPRPWTSDPTSPPPWHHLLTPSPRTKTNPPADLGLTEPPPCTAQLVRGESRNQLGSCAVTREAHNRSESAHLNDKLR